MKTLQAYWRKHSEAGKKANLENLKTATTALQKLGVDLVRMTYSGGGDSGDYHYPIYKIGDEDLEDRSGYGPSSHTLGASGEFSSEVVVPYVTVGQALTYEKGEAVYDSTVPTSRAEIGLCEAVFSLLESAVSNQYGGWENNEGAEGTATLDVEHGHYIMETEWDSHIIRVEDAGD